MEPPILESEAESSSKLTVEKQQQAGHYEILGETYAAFELFENGWNPYSRFLDIDKVDFILRKRDHALPIYREAQVKYGKLYPVGSKWQQELFTLTTWRFFKPGEFDGHKHRKDFFIIYVMSAESGYEKDIFIFPVAVFCELIAAAVPRKDGDGIKKAMNIARSVADPSRWYMLRLGKKFAEINDTTCFEVTKYRRAFHLLNAQ